VWAALAAGAGPPVARATAQDAAPRPAIRVEAYRFEIALPAAGDTVRASATVVFRRAAAASDTLALDLVGLAVDSVLAYGVAAPAHPVAVPFQYDGTVLRIPAPPRPVAQRESVAVFYRGAPRDGLLLRPDGRGRQAVFADNWPERARFWIPTVDLPADKAAVTWRVGVPAGWRVIANGRLSAVDSVAGGRTWWRYVERHPIPSYTMVLGAARLAVSRHRPATAGRDTIPIDVWTEPEDSAFADSVPFRRATEIVETMERLVGPFPFERLAHVESSTRYGGMENSTAIFYPEGGYVARRMGEGVVRHETAHQWFGDAVTERDFHELWLSEGFADYFAVVVGAALDGDSLLGRGMAGLERGYLASPVVGRPLVDTTVTEPTRLLNANSYNKGAWVLHMLRGTVGDSAFWRGIRAYYRTWRDSSVTSAHLQRAMEGAAGRPLGWFFHQWLRQPGYPRLDVAWRWDAAAGRAVIEVSQVQPEAWGLFRLPSVALELRAGAQVVARRRVDLSAAHQTVTVDLSAPPTDVAVDPDGQWLLTSAVRSAP
jgi:aminopeptidase N